jgi:hypothetical protein
MVVSVSLGKTTVSKSTVNIRIFITYVYYKKREKGISQGVYLYR